MSDKRLVAAAGKLKTVKRQGWVDAGIPGGDVESVADHSFRVAFIVAFIAPAGGHDPLKAVRMALLHDLAESAVGDLTPSSGVTARRKARMEREAFKRLGSGELLALWREFDEGSSPEAKLVRQADILERVIQAGEYDARGAGRDLARFRKGWRANVLPARFRELVRP